MPRLCKSLGCVGMGAAVARHPAASCLAAATCMPVPSPSSLLMKAVPVYPSCLSFMTYPVLALLHAGQAGAAGLCPAGPCDSLPPTAPPLSAHLPQAKQEQLGSALPARHEAAEARVASYREQLRAIERQMDELSHKLQVGGWACFVWEAERARAMHRNSCSDKAAAG